MRQRRGWYLYDFADSILIFTGVLYFPKWIVIQSGAGEFAYNLTIAIITVLLVVTNPIAGYLSDVKYGRLLFLRLAQQAVAGAALLIVLAGFAFPPGAARTVLALGAFGVLMYGHQASSAFYNALLPAVAETAGAYAEVAGNGFAFRRMGALVGIIALLPLAPRTVPTADVGPPMPFLAATLVYVVLTAVALRLMPDELPQAAAQPPRLRKMIDSLNRDVRRLRGDRRLLIFLAGSLVFMDAILTVEANLTLYMDRVMHAGESAKAYLLVLLLVMSALGAKTSSPIVARLGARASFTAILACGALALASLSVLHDATLFAVLLAVVGLTYGAISTCTRITYLLLIPDDRRAEYLALYASFERCASFTGPLAWGMIVGGLGVDPGYRVAMLVMAGLVVTSIPIVRAVDFSSTSRDVIASPLDACEPA